jgi:hypothetical protein
MLSKILIILLCIQTSLSAQIVPDNLKELTEPLCACDDVTCVTVDGVSSDEYGVPHSCFCETLKQEALQKSPAVLAWYTAFTTCRMKEHHELIRSLGRLAVPAIAALTADALFKKWSRLFRVPAVCLTALFSYIHSNRLYTPLSDYLDSRADAAALETCETEAELRAVLGYLEALHKKTKADPVVQEQSGQYQLLTINAYDKAQSNICSYVNIQVKIPLVWLFSGSIESKLQSRIAALKTAL